MSDARQQAIDAMLVAVKGSEAAIRFNEISERSVEAMLNAIPGDVHAQLAINKGALIETDKKIVIGRDYQAGKYHNYFAPLYRLAGKDPQP